MAEIVCAIVCGNVCIEKYKVFAQTFSFTQYNCHKLHSESFEKKSLEF